MRATADTARWTSNRLHVSRLLFNKHMPRYVTQPLFIIYKN